jgi:hypothetical protein
MSYLELPEAVGSGARQVKLSCIGRSRRSHIGGRGALVDLGKHCVKAESRLRR